ncbi:unnamed protein product [Amoebophrya sp. A25]|nr:unnamed protein product [Amoebophrya sp. A25]|eukprot:GSA25T00020899001.1
MNKWNAFWTGFTSAYSFWFIDAIPPKKRHFAVTYEDASSGEGPQFLCGLIRHMVLADGMRYHAYLMHWLACISFAVSQRQHASRRIERDSWKQVDETLRSKRGTVHDHCTLLCSILCTIGKDAYVCKGTIRQKNVGKNLPKFSMHRLKVPRETQYTEHTWVMTRETDGSVILWETTQAMTFHLGKRWCGRNEKPVGYARLRCNQNLDRKWLTHEDDPKIATSHSVWDLLGRRRDALARVNKFNTLPIAPMEEFATQAEATALPYYSIEIAFNRENVWGNLRNHDPAWIRYDFLDELQWKPLLDQYYGTDRWLIRSDPKSCVVGPAFEKQQAQVLIDKIRHDVEEALRFARLRMGLNTKLYRSTLLAEALTDFLDHMEKQCLLDPAHTTNKDKVDKTLRKGSFPFNGSLLQNLSDAKGYPHRARRAWARWWKKWQELDIRVAGLPVPENTFFDAIPFHFSTMDLREIRAYLSTSKDVRDLFLTENEETEFVVHASVYPLQHEVGSVWVFVGRLTPMTELEVDVAARGEKKNEKALNVLRAELKSIVLAQMTESLSAAARGG